MISIIITTCKEPRTLPRAIEKILEQKINQDYEILVVGPDQETEKIVNRFSQNYSQIKYLKDKGKGKPAALNLAFQRAKGQIYILTDGDVYISKNALNSLLKPFKNTEIGAATGQPISLNKKDNLFGYWAYFLTQAAHYWRIKGNNFPCSGYLYAFRNIIKKIPKNALAEDGVITKMIREKNYKVKYVPEAKVFVKYPNNLKDWLKQKVRSTGGYLQNWVNSSPKTNARRNRKKERNFWQEFFNGLKLFFIIPVNLKEYFWTLLLYLVRIYLWLKIFYQIKIKKKSLIDIWQRIESTK